MIKQWNESAAKSDRLTGAKFMCVRNILDLDHSIRDHLITAVNKHGWKGPSTDAMRKHTLHTSRLPVHVLIPGHRLTIQ